LNDKIRLDVKLFSDGLTESREKAKAFIMAGQVYVNGEKAKKAGDLVNPEDKIELRGINEFVSRGGYKLKKALSSFNIDLNDKVCIDIGASTGGFTDCMLQNGAKKVYSVDVGYGQLAWKIRTDPRVVNLERTNFRYITKDLIPDEADFASVDVSFISLKLVLPAAKPLLKDGAEMVCLIKPQFEAGRENVGKKGVVRDPQVHLDVINGIIEFVKSINFAVLGLDFSPIKGPEGNIEYLLYIKKSDSSESVLVNPENIVNKSHSLLDK
jgi:23S rRNA (cytidine1920-2'-O)/16S rRNA (cytidine1409-2'-O)-methyltransferase